MHYDKHLKATAQFKSFSEQTSVSYCSCVVTRRHNNGTVTMELSPVQMTWCLPDVFGNYKFVLDSCSHVGLVENTWLAL